MKPPISELIPTQHIEHYFRRTLAIAAVALASVFSPPSVAHAEIGAEPPAVEYEVPTGPQIQYGFGDPGAVVDNYLNKRETALAEAKKMGGSIWRVMVYQDRYVTDEDKQKYWDGIKAVDAHGYDLYLTVASNTKAPWRAGALREFTKEVLEDVAGLEVRPPVVVAPGNEVNYEETDSGGQEAAPGLTPGQTYRIDYDEARTEISKVFPDAKIAAFGLGSDSKAKDFVREAASYCPQVSKKVRRCSAMVMDLIGGHPYQFNSSPDEPDKGGLEMGSLPQFEADMIELHKEGLIEQPDGQMPELAIEEMGYQGDAAGDWAEANENAVVRATFTLRALAQSCKSKLTRIFMWHQIVYNPPWRDKHWSTPFLSKSGQWLRVAKVMERFTHSPKHADCVILPESE